MAQKMLASGQVAGILGDLPSCAELIETIVAGAIRHLQRRLRGSHLRILKSWRRTSDKPKSENYLSEA
jgi:hypothetical protein